MNSTDKQDWATQMAIAYSAGLNGEKCPNGFVAAWRQGLQHRKNKQKSGSK